MVLAGLRFGWALAAPGVAARMRAARAVAPAPAFGMSAEELSRGLDAVAAALDAAAHLETARR